MLEAIITIALISVAVGFIWWAFGGNFKEGTRKTAGCIFEAIFAIIIIFVAVLIINALG